MGMTPAFGAPRTRSPLHALWLSALVVAADYLSGALIQFPATFILPVAYAAWHGSRRWAITLAVLLPVTRFWTVLSWGAPWGLFETSINAGIRISVFAFVAWLVASLADKHRALTAEVTLLETLLPMCSYCKRVRNEGGEWEPLEKYLAEHSSTTFTHGMCATCLEKHWGDHLARSPDGTPKG